MSAAAVILTEEYEPPTSKRQLRRAIANDARGVLIEESLDYGRTADELEEGETVYVAGPDPESDIRFTAEIARVFGRIIVR